MSQFSTLASTIRARRTTILQVCHYILIFQPQLTKSGSPTNCATSFLSLDNTSDHIEQESHAEADNTSDNQDDEAEDDGFGDFDNFEQGDEDAEFGDFDEADFQEASEEAAPTPAAPVQSLPQLAEPLFVSDSRPIIILHSSFATIIFLPSMLYCCHYKPISVPPTPLCLLHSLRSRVAQPANLRPASLGFLGPLLTTQ